MKPGCIQLAIVSLDHWLLLLEKRHTPLASLNKLDGFGTRIGTGRAFGSIPWASVNKNGPDPAGDAARSGPKSSTALKLQDQSRAVNQAPAMAVLVSIRKRSKPLSHPRPRRPAPARP